VPADSKKGGGTELSKLGKTDLGADGADAVQAKSIWLVSGATVTLNFLKMSMPRMGPATAARKNCEEKSLPWNWTIFNKSPKGDWLSICPLEQGARWINFGSAGNNTQCCPSVNQIPVMSQLISKKNESSI
jgi:hypothetical protein